MSDSGIELNRDTAKRLSKEFSKCPSEHCQKSIEDKLFTALQIAQKRGQVIAEFRADIRKETTGDSANEN